ncbi:MAG: cytochrome c biogenesis CcdA family protein [Gemmobacter sp.]
MDIVLGYLAGLLTLINPCVLPVLPVVLASAVHRHRLAPLALAAGMGVSFVALGLAVSALGPAVGIDPDEVSRAAALVMVAFGLVLLVPAVGHAFEGAAAGFAARADARIDGAVAGGGLSGQVLAGALLGAVWSPCIGPTLGGAIALASAGTGLGQAAAIMIAFALGVATLILALAWGARGTIRRRQAALRSLAARSRPIMGAVFVLVGAAIWFRLDHVAATWLIDVLPPWLLDLSVSI